MKRTLLILIVIGFLPREGNAQLSKLRPLEVTAAAGTTHSFTDIGRYSEGNNYLGLRDISKVNTGFAVSGNVRYRLNSQFAARVNLTYGYLHASDIHGSEPERGHEAIIEFFEPSVIGEFYVVRNKRENAYLFVNSKRSGKHRLFAYFDLYVFAGIGAVIWDVTPNPAFALYITDTKGITGVIPAGIGIARNFSGSFKGGIELGGRYLLGDDLEAREPEGSGNDSYYTLNLTLTWRFKTRKYPSF